MRIDRTRLAVEFVTDFARVRRVAKASFAVCITTVAACGPGRCGAPTPPPREQILVLGTTHEPDTLDPVFTEVAGAQEVVRLLFADLTTHDDRWALVPELAASLPEAKTTTSGEMRIEWQLKPDLRWSDGVALTTQDVAFGFTIESDPTLETGSQAFVSRVASVEPRTAQEVAVTWRAPAVDFRGPRVHAVLPSHAYPPRTPGRPFAGMGRTPTSSGPFRLRAWVAGEHLTVERNPHWAGPRPALDAIMWRFFSSEDSFEAQLRTGGIDALGEAAGLGLDQADSIATRLAESHVVQFTDSGVWLHLDVRLDDPVGSDVRVRRAISQAIDRSELARLMYGGHATPSYGLFPPRHPAFTDPPTVPVDLAQAAQAITESGHEGAKLGLMFASGSASGERAVTYIGDRLSKIGLVVELRPVPFRVLFSTMRDKAHPALTMYAWRSSPDWDARSILHSKGAQNFTGVNDPQFDQSFDAIASADETAWVAALRRVETRFCDLLPAIPLVFRQSASVRPKNLRGWKPTGSRTPVTWNADEWILQR